MSSKTLLTNAKIATMQTDGAPYGLIENGAIVRSEQGDGGCLGSS